MHKGYIVYTSEDAAFDELEGLNDFHRRNLHPEHNGDMSPFFHRVLPFPCGFPETISPLYCPPSFVKHEPREIFCADAINGKAENINMVIICFFTTLIFDSITKVSNYRHISK